MTHSEELIEDHPFKVNDRVRVNWLDDWNNLHGLEGTIVEMRGSYSLPGWEKPKRLVAVEFPGRKKKSIIGVDNLEKINGS